MNRICHLRGTEAGQADQTSVAHSLHDGKLAEILVESDENPVFVERIFENRFVAGILRPQPGPYDIVAKFREAGDGAAPDAGIQKQPRHQEASRVGKSSIRSCRASRAA